MSSEVKENTIPAGYWKDSRDVLTPESLVKPVDKERNAMVRAIPLSQSLRDFKQDTFADIQALVDLSAEQYGATIGGKKGNVTLYTYDGRYKVQRAMQEESLLMSAFRPLKSLLTPVWLSGRRMHALSCWPSLTGPSPRIKRVRSIRVECCSCVAMTLPTRADCALWMRWLKLYRWSAAKATSVFMNGLVTVTSMCRSLSILPGCDMQNPSTINHVNQYTRYAIGAVRAELAGRYGDAAKLWSKAQISPCEAHQRKWAMHRRRYCLRASELEWGLNSNAG